MAATRDLDRGRTTPEAVEERRAGNLAELVELERQAGLDFFSDGMLGWQDLFRPLVDASPGLTTGPLVRWFDTNTFYRAPEVRGPVGFEERPSAPFVPSDEVPRPRVVTLPSPYLFSRLVLHPRPNQLMQELARGLLRPAAERLVAGGAELLHLQEPWLAFYGIHEEDWDPFEQAIKTVTEGLSATTVLHTFFGDAAPHADRLQALPVDVVGFDFVETDFRNLGSGWTKAVLAGCVDGRRSVLESVEEIEAFVERVQDALGAPAVYLSSNSDLELLPRDLAAEKVRRLGEAASRLKARTREPVG